MEPINTLGRKLAGHEQRDAIHIAILPVISDEDYLRPGDRLQFVAGSKQVVRKVVRYSGGVGVVDPFISDEDYIRKGERFWMFLLPNTITGLRHEWTHPEVDDPKVLGESERWLKDFAGRWGFDYDEMIAVALGGSNDWGGEYITAQGRDLHSSAELGEDHALFWQHLAVATGRTFDQQHVDRVGWSCSC